MYTTSTKAQFSSRQHCVLIASITMYSQSWAMSKQYIVTTLWYTHLLSQCKAQRRTVIVMLIPSIVGYIEWSIGVFIAQRPVYLVYLHPCIHVYFGPPIPHIPRQSLPARCHVNRSTHKIHKLHRIAISSVRISQSAESVGKFPLYIALVLPKLHIHHLEWPSQRLFHHLTCCHQTAYIKLRNAITFRIESFLPI